MYDSLSSMYLLCVWKYCLVNLLYHLHALPFALVVIVICLAALKIVGLPLAAEYCSQYQQLPQVFATGPIGFVTWPYKTRTSITAKASLE